MHRLKSASGSLHQKSLQGQEAWWQYRSTCLELPVRGQSQVPIDFKKTDGHTGPEIQSSGRCPKLRSQVRGPKLSLIKPKCWLQMLLGARCWNIKYQKLWLKKIFYFGCWSSWSCSQMYSSHSGTDNHGLYWCPGPDFRTPVHRWGPTQKYAQTSRKLTWLLTQSTFRDYIGSASRIRGCKGTQSSVYDRENQTPDRLPEGVQTEVQVVSVTISVWSSTWSKGLQGILQENILKFKWSTSTDLTSKQCRTGPLLAQRFRSCIGYRIFTEIRMNGCVEVCFSDVQWVSTLPSICTELQM